MVKLKRVERAVQRVRMSDPAVRLKAAGTMLLIGALLLQLVWCPAPRLVWNVSNSAPKGLYFVRPGASHSVGDMVVAKLPDPWRGLAAHRHYLPRNVPLVKRVAAIEGDEVCARGRRVLINDVPTVLRFARDGAGRALPWWRGCRVLHRGEVFLLMSAPASSFDGRYFGVMKGGAVVGRATLIWPA